MAAIKQLAAVTRSGTGKGAARSVRREGRIPAVIYGGGVEPEPISVDFKEINKFIYAGHFLTSIFELEIEGRKERVLPRDYQLDVVADRPLHVDFLRLSPGSRVRIGVPVHVVNREASPGLKKGGALNLVLHNVEVMAPADAIPESITIDLTGLDFHELGACVGDQHARRVPPGQRQGRSHGGDDRAPDGHGRGDAGRRGDGGCPRGWGGGRACARGRRSRQGGAREGRSGRPCRRRFRQGRGRQGRQEVAAGGPRRPKLPPASPERRLRPPAG